MKGRSRSSGNALENPASGIGPVAAIMVEPVQGNGGVVVPPAGFLRGLRELCDRHEAVLIFDEIQCGFGRTGRTWAAEHEGVVPDLMTVGKGIGGGMAVSAVVGRARFMSHWAPGAHTSTFMGNAINLAAGRAAIGVFGQERLAERSAALGARLIGRLRLGPRRRAARRRGPRPRPLRRHRDRRRSTTSRTPDPARNAAIRRAAFERGVLLGSGGHHENVIKICPPLTIEEPLLDAALDITIDTIKGTR